MKTINLLKSPKLTMAVAITVLIPSLASAAIIASDGFETDNVAPLSGQGGGVGWTGNWTAPGNITRADVVNSTANPLIFFPANGLPIDGATRALEVALTGAASSQLAGVRTLAAPIAQSFYVGYLVRYTGAGTWAGANNTFSFHLGTNASQTATLNFGLRGGAANEFMIRYATGAPVAGASTGGELINNTTYYLVCKINWDGVSAFTSANMWLNPTATDDVDTPAGDASLSGFSSLPITHIFFRQAVLDADDILRADEVKFGTAWSDLVQLPPPIPMVRVATLPTALGVDVPAQNITAGNAITVYANAYDDNTNFLYNTYASWSVENVSGGVVAGNLVPASNGKSATFTGGGVGNCTIRASANATNTYESGTITVLAGPAATVRVETADDGSGTVVPTQSLAPAATVTGYAITRDAAGNFLANENANWSLTNKTSAIVDGDLAPASGLSATFTANLSGTVNIRADFGGLTPVTSGQITVSRALTWVGGGANPWDFTTPNWTPDFGSTFTNFLDSDDVTFDGSGSNSPAVNLTTTVAPHSVNVTGGPYTFAGVGGISGSTSLINSSGTLLTLLNTNTYAGGTVVSLGGTLQLGNGTAASGSFGTGPVSINTGGTSPVFNRTDVVSAPYVISNTISGLANFLMEFKTGAVKFAGTGDNNQARAVVRNGATLILAKTSGKDLGANVLAVSGPVLDIELGGKVVCGGPGTSADHIDSGGNTAQGLRYVTFNGTFDLNSTESLGGITSGSSGTIDNTSTNAAILTVGTGINDSSSATFAGTIQNTGTGALGITQTGTNTWILGLANTYRGDTKVTGGILQLGNANSMQNSTLDYPTGDTGRLSFGSLTAATFGGLKSGKTLILTNDSGAAVALTIGGNNVANTYSGNLSGPGSLTKVGTANHTMSGTNTYSGTTTVSAGTLLVNGRLDGVGAVSVGGSGTLAGTGTVGGPVSGTGTIRPGNNGIGTLTVSNTATLAGITIAMDLNRTNSPNSDKLTATTLVLGGTLNVTNLSSINRLKTNDTFTLFSSPSAFSGSITIGTLPPLWPGLSWNTASLDTAGTIAVTGTEVPPVISSTVQSGTNLTLSGSGGLAGATYYLVSTNNVTAPLASWPRIATNTFAADGNFTNSLPFNVATPQQYFSVQVP